MKPLIILFLLPCSFFSMAQQRKMSYTKINFENKSGVRIDQGKDNTWQIAKTQKYNTDSTRSVSYVIVTDSVNHYPVNNNSSFQFSIPIDKNTSYLSLSFWHKFDMDTLGDAGKIEVSYDKGITWSGIRKYPTVDYIMNDASFYKEQKNAKDKKDNSNIITGNSQGWKQMYFRWYWRSYEVKMHSMMKDNVPDTMIVRFSFSSDRIQTNKEGWMIDDILIEQAGRLESIIDSCALPKHSNYPNPFPQIRIYTFDHVLYGPNIRIVDYTGQVIFQDIQDATKPMKPRVVIPVFPMGIHFFEVRTGTGTLIERIAPVPANELRY